MKATVVMFAGGPWDGRRLRTDSDDYEEQLLAAGCYEMSHHGTIGTGCGGLSCEALGFARRHGWVAEEANARGRHEYYVAERRETETEIVITFNYRPPRGS